MRKLVTCLAIVVVVGLAMTSKPQPAQAQKQYFDAFVAKYDAVADEAKEKKCAVCHGQNKKMRSDYAKALEEALGAKKVKDVEKINAALDTIAKKDSGNGTTYGDLLKDGKLPAPYSE